MAALEAYNITHRYGRVTALDDLSFTVGEGELFGFIGPDGAGKTTLFRIAATLIIPAGGRMTLFGLNTVSRYRELRNHIGYMPGRFSLYSGPHRGGESELLCHNLRHDGPGKLLPH